MKLLLQLISCKVSCRYKQHPKSGGSTSMTNITIFGAGNMGDAIAGVLGAGGASIDHITSSDTDKTVTGDVAILAVPYPELEDIIGRYGAQLAGKIVVDITNP